MAEKADPEIVVGLSEEEKEDLEEMITSFRKEQSAGSPDSGDENVQKKIASMSENLADFGDMLLKYDDKMKSFYKIIRLFCKKDEIFNQRVDAIIEIMKGRSNL